jgi:hypothetical protein
MVYRIEDGRQTPMTDEDHGQPNEELVEVFDTKQESEAMVLGGLLQSAGIESTVIWREAEQDLLPGVGSTVVLVRQEQANEARQIIADYRAHPTTDGDVSAAPETTPSNDPSAA